MVIKGSTVSGKIKVLHLLNNYGDSSISRIVQRLIIKLGATNFSWHVGVMSCVGDMRDDFKELGAQVIDFSSGGNGLWGTAERIRTYVRDHGITIVHTHTPRTIIMAALALRLAQKPLHMATKHILQAPHDRHWGLLYTLLDRISLYLPDLTVAVSNRIYSQMISLPGIRKEKATVIQNAIDCDAFYLPGQRASCRAELKIDPVCPVIGCAVRIEKVKRLDLLLNGFSLVLNKYPEARLIIVGDGKIRLSLETLASELGIAHAVIWTGFRKDIPRILSAVDIYIQSSVNEGLSLSVLEAMAAAKAVVLTDVGGAREVIMNGKTGILIQPGSSLAIGEAITHLLDNPENRMSIAKSARSHVNTEFGLERMISMYRDKYETMAMKC